MQLSPLRLPIQLKATPVLHPKRICREERTRATRVNSWARGLCSNRDQGTNCWGKRNRRTLSMLFSWCRGHSKVERDDDHKVSPRAQKALRQEHVLLMLPQVRSQPECFQLWAYWQAPLLYGYVPNVLPLGLSQEKNQGQEKGPIDQGQGLEGGKESPLRRHNPVKLGKCSEISTTWIAVTEHMFKLN